MDDGTAGGRIWFQRPRGVAQRSILFGRLLPPGFAVQGASKENAYTNVVCQCHGTGPPQMIVASCVLWSWGEEYASAAGMTRLRGSESFFFCRVRAHTYVYCK